MTKSACVLGCVLLFAVVTTARPSPQGIGDEPARAAALTAGRDTFFQFCAPCHGPDGKGGGPVAMSLLAKPPDLTQVSKRYGGKFPLDTLEQMLTLVTRLQASAHGSEQMPIWGRMFRALDTTPALVNARVANLLAYLESIQR